MIDFRLLAALGVLPAFLLLWYAEQFERRIKEPSPGWRYRILAASGFATLPIGLSEAAMDPIAGSLQEPMASVFEAYIQSALPEELGKFTCLYLLTRGRLAPGTRYGAFLYALHASMGFAAVENVVALFGTEDLQGMTVLLVLRAYLSIPTHLFAGGVVGYFWATRRFDDGVLRLPAGVLIAVLIHGSYNAMMLAVERLPDDYDNEITSYAAAGMAVPLLGAIVLHVLAYRLRGLDRADGR